MLVVHCVSSPCMCTDQSTAALLLPVVSRLKRHIVILPGTASCDMKTAVNLNFSNSHAGDASAVLPFPPEDEELLQQAVITALRLTLIAMPLNCHILCGHDTQMYSVTGPADRQWKWWYATPASTLLGLFDPAVSLPASLDPALCPQGCADLYTLVKCLHHLLSCLCT